MKTFKDFLNEDMNDEGWMNPPSLRKGKSYLAAEVDNPDSFEKPIVVIVKDIEREDRYNYEVAVELENGNTENWYLSKDDYVFKQW
tara:strand:- start:114289 stop:114546 length:258 start_codon:yes stop_codon:yes gene_type:complete